MRPLAATRLQQIGLAVSNGNHKLRTRIETAINDALEELSVVRVKEARGEACMRRKKTSPKVQLPALKAVGAEIATAVRERLPLFKPRIKPKLSDFMLEHARNDTNARIRPYPRKADMEDAMIAPDTAQVVVRTRR